LGADFLGHFKLLVDVAGGRLIPGIPATTGSCGTAAGDGPAAAVAAAVQQPPTSPPSTSTTSISPPSISPPSTFTISPQHDPPPAVTEPWSGLLQQFSSVTPTGGQLPRQPAKGVQHQISTTGQPVTAKFRRLDPVRLAAARAEFDSMLAAGIVHRSHSSWSSPFHMVRKKCGGWRPCGDFRRLNNITAADRYPLPNMADLSARLAGCQFFTKLDLQKGYLQVAVAEEDIHSGYLNF
jgi:hypothetical protein